VLESPSLYSFSIKDRRSAIEVPDPPTVKVLFPLLATFAPLAAVPTKTKVSPISMPKEVLPLSKT
jgi:hypothetical protein